MIMKKTKILRACAILFVLVLVQATAYSCQLAAKPDEIIDDLAIGGSIDGACRHYETCNDSFHNFSGALIDYVGEKEFAAWLDQTAKDKKIYENTNCIYYYCNIVRFVRDFDIKREEFQAILDNIGVVYYRYDYNLDIIYSEDEKLIDQYYCSGKQRENKYLLNECLYGIKFDLWVYIRDNFADEFEQWVREMNDSKIYSNEFTGDMRQWSIPEFIARFNVSREKVEEIIDRYIVDREPTEIMTAIEFDIDLLYEDARELSQKRDSLDAKNYSADTIETDFLYIKIDEEKLKSVNEAIDNYFRSENIVNDDPNQFPVAPYIASE